MVTFRFNVLVLAVILTIFQYIPHIEAALKCYKCLVAPPTYYSNETNHLCKDFDYSEKFLVDCPYSTFCMKTISSAKIPVLINGTERGCANQKLETQQYYDGRWHARVSIEEPYTEGCYKINDKGAKTSSTEQCYCKGDRCNGSRMYRSSGFLYILFTVISCYFII